MYRAVSLAWLEVSDALLLAPGWEHSKGAVEEYEFAQQRMIPTFTSLAALLGWYQTLLHENKGSEPCKHQV